MLVRLSAVLGILGILTAGCGGSSSNPASPTTPGGTGSGSNSLFNGISASFASDSKFGIVAAHQNGEKFALATQTGPSNAVTKVNGGTLTLTDGNNVVVYAGDDGLPARAVFGDVVVLFANYTANSADVAAVASNGSFAVARGVAIDASILADLRSLPAQLSTSAFIAGAGLRPTASGSSFNLALALKYGGVAFSAVGCLTSLAIAGGLAVPSAGASIVITGSVAATVCTSAGVKVLALINPAFDNPALSAANTFIGIAGCAGTLGIGCVGTILSLAGNADTSAQATQSQQGPAISAAINEMNALNCRFTIAPTSQSFGSNGGSGSVAVTALPIGCTINTSWTATRGTGFIAITSASSGTGSGTVSYSVASNSSTSSRSGTLIIASQTFSVTQAGASVPSCSYGTNLTTQYKGASGGQDVVVVTGSPNGCSGNWTATSNASFISVTSGSSGSGSGTFTVVYLIASNSSTSSRTGTLAIAGQTVTVIQEGASIPSCSYTISPISQSFSSSGGSGTVTVTGSPSGCSGSWTASSNTSFVSITSGSSGSGSGTFTVGYSVSSNSSTSSRSGTLTVAGQTFTVSQQGATQTTTCQLTVSVQGNLPWQSSGCSVNSGDQISFSASGTIRFDSSSSATPNGSGRGAALASSNGTCNYLLCGSSIPQHSLVGRVGSSSLADFTTGFFVGSSRTVTATATGTLYLGFNDGFVLADRSGLDSGGARDNSGSFSVSVTVRR